MLSMVQLQLQLIKYCGVCGDDDDAVKSDDEAQTTNSGWDH
jgi:hypothetical protein